MVVEAVPRVDIFQMDVVDFGKGIAVENRFGGIRGLALYSLLAQHRSVQTHLIPSHLAT